MLDFTDVAVWNHWQGRSDVSDVLVSRGASLDTFNDYGCAISDKWSKNTGQILVKHTSLKVSSLDTFNDHGYQRKHTSLMSQPLLTEREHPLLRSGRLPDLFTGLYDA